MISERAFAQSFDSFWKEALPLLTSQFVTSFNNAYARPLLSASGKQLKPLSPDRCIKRNDLVAEYSFHLARLRYLSREPITSEIEEACQFSAKAIALKNINFYRGEYWAPGGYVSPEEKSGVLKIANRYESLYKAFPPGAVVEFCPAFPGAGFIDSCAGDLAIDSCLIEVKTIARRFTGRDLRQVLVYLALAANSGATHWTQFALFNPRYGTLHVAGIDQFITNLSGGRAPAELFEELISFVNNHEVVIDSEF